MHNSASSYREIFYIDANPEITIRFRDDFKTAKHTYLKDQEPNQYADSDGNPTFGGADVRSIIYAVHHGESLPKGLVITDWLDRTNIHTMVIERKTKKAIKKKAKKERRTPFRIGRKVNHEFCSKYFEIDGDSKSGLTFIKELETKYVTYKVGARVGEINHKGYWSFMGIELHRIIYMMANNLDSLNDRPMVVDHIDRNKLNNNPENLRLCHSDSNVKNVKRKRNRFTGLIGVGRRKGQYIAKAQFEGVRYTMGTYDCPVDAARAYDEFVIDRDGEFAVTNKSLGYIDYD